MQTLLETDVWGCFLPLRLTGGVDHDLLRNFLLELLEYLDLLTLKVHLWLTMLLYRILFIQYGNYPNNVFPEQWIKGGGPIAGPAPTVE
jgi:hypothetical protein